MRHLIQRTERVLQHKTSIATTTTTKTQAPARSRVPRYINNNTRQTISMTHPNHQVPQLSTPSVPRVEQSTKTNRKHRTKKHKTKFHTIAPAHNTRSRTQAAEATPASSTRERTQLTRLSTVDATIAQLENDVHQALAVMDTDTIKLLSHRKLMKNPKHKNNWSMSSANEFRWLANGVGGRIKNPTNTIAFITRNNIPHNQRKYVTSGKFMCNVRPEKKENNRTRFTVSGEKIDYPGEVATPTADMLVAKILSIGVISTKGAWFMTIYTSNFYLTTPLKLP